MRITIIFLFSFLFSSLIAQNSLIDELECINYPKIKIDIPSILTVSAINVSYETKISKKRSQQVSFRYMTNYHLSEQVIIGQYYYGFRLSGEQRFYYKSFGNGTLKYQAIEVFAKYERVSINDWINKLDGLYEEKVQFGLNAYVFGLHYKLGDVLYTTDNKNISIDYFVGAGFRFKLFDVKGFTKDEIANTSYFINRTRYGELLNPSVTGGISISFGLPDVE